MFRTITLLSLLSFSSCAGAEFIPDNANKYKRTLIRYAQHYYGIHAPVPVFAAQIHKESTWNPHAKSPYAEGLSQFTPDTAKDVSKKYPELVANEPLDPTWSIRAMLLYDLDLKTRVDAINECNDWAFTFAMYNGGPGWIWREKNLAEEAGVDRNTYWNAVENFNAGRRADAKAENQGYPKKILYTLQELYNDEGSWGRSQICLELAEEIIDKVIEEIEEEVVIEESEVIETTPDPIEKPKPKKSLWQKILDWF